ncbi:MAG: hypothetical protein ACRBN8_25935 [Nannocystales bacterium]
MDLDLATALTWLLPSLPFGLAGYAIVSGRIPVRRWMSPDGQLRRNAHPVKYWMYVAMLLLIGGVWLSAAG